MCVLCIHTHFDRLSYQTNGEKRPHAREEEVLGNTLLCPRCYLQPGTAVVIISAQVICTLFKVVNIYKSLNRLISIYIIDFYKTSTPGRVIPSCRGTAKITVLKR